MSAPRRRRRPAELTAEQYRAESTSEQQVQDKLTDWVTLRGGLWAHVRDSRGTATEGLPDVVAVVPALGLLLLVECKDEKGQLRELQVQWLQALEQVHTKASGVVRPSTIDQFLDDCEAQGADPAGE